MIWGGTKPARRFLSSRLVKIGRLVLSLEVLWLVLIVSCSMVVIIALKCLSLLCLHVRCMGWNCVLTRTTILDSFLDLPFIIVHHSSLSGWSLWYFLLQQSAISSSRHVCLWLLQRISLHWISSFLLRPTGYSTSSCSLGHHDRVVYQSCSNWRSRLACFLAKRMTLLGMLLLSHVVCLVWEIWKYGIYNKVTIRVLLLWVAVALAWF